MIRGIIIAVLSVAVIGTAYWGYQEHQEKNAILINAENNYQRAFHELTYDVDLLHDKIGTTLAMNSRNSISPALAEVWRVTSEAHNEVGHLPLTLLPFNKTEEFLAKIGDFSYKTAIRDLEKEPLTEEEYQTLQSLYEQSADIQNELRKVQHIVLDNNLRWMDVELALANNDEPSDNTIIDGFKTVEKKVEGYSESNLAEVTTGPLRDFSHLKGEELTKEQALEKAKDFIKIKNNQDVLITENGEGSDYGFYSITVRNGKTQANLDITKVGGHPLYLIQNREVKKAKLSLNDGYNKAAQFLNKHGFENMTLFESAQYDNTGVYVFVSEENGVRIYPDAIRMKVALDDGSVLAFSAEDYLSFHKKREIAKPSISAEEAKSKLNPNLQVMDQNVALIVNDVNEEVLCYEFLGTINQDTYRIYINAENGDEEKVEKLQNAEPIYEEVV
ncbi:MAG TPA: germination protein YpeB [Bacillus sp. (in: firmicutes)]|uniref:germination protein YpeB n=1 Tax=Bacillus litorisediminis TaxID=2922713 RepID=UPI001FAC5431|nr:germination protein YpeB [Bacillus litorisediminis]HWO75844.1 germination protein YpeB [Bacillus sp. (in: firmicutes)]